MKRVTMVIFFKYIHLFTIRSAIVKILLIVLRLNSTVVNLKLILMLLLGVVLFLMKKAKREQLILVTITEVERAHLALVTIVELE